MELKIKNRNELLKLKHEENFKDNNVKSDKINWNYLIFNTKKNIFFYISDHKGGVHQFRWILKFKFKIINK